MHAPTNNNNSSSSDFHDLMKELLRTMQMEPPAGPSPEVYSFTFEQNIEINIFSACAGMIDLLAEPGIMHNVKAHALLLDLMTLNRHEMKGDCLSIGVDPKSGKVSLWTRQPLAQLQVDVLRKLLEQMLTRVDQVRQYLQTPSVARGGARVERARLAQLAREGKFHE